VRTREVFVFVRRGEEHLVLHRSELQGGYWHGVAGGIEGDESPAEAAARELAEETGLAAAPDDLACSYVYNTVTVHCFVAEAPAGWEPVLDWEHDAHRWCSPAEADALLHWPEPREVLRRLHAARCEPSF
jgi:8-oxo-dGTP pyrophosphatase MutT (NUDIX family)